MTLKRLVLEITTAADTIKLAEELAEKLIMMTPMRTNIVVVAQDQVKKDVEYIFNRLFLGNVQCASH